jgi:archaellum component FlaC
MHKSVYKRKAAQKKSFAALSIAMSNNVAMIESLMTPPSSPLLSQRNRNITASGFNPTTNSTMPKAEINTAAWLTTPSTSKPSVTADIAQKPTSFVFGATSLLFKPENNNPAIGLPTPFTTFGGSDASFNHLRGQLDIVQAQFDTVRDELEFAKTEVKGLKGHFEDIRAEVEGVKTEVKAATESIASLQQLNEFIQTKALQHEFDIENLKGIVKILQTQHTECEGRIQGLEQMVAVKGLTFVQTLGLIFGVLDNLDNALTQVFWPQGKLTIEGSGKVYGDQLVTVTSDEVEFTGHSHSHNHVALHDDELGGETDVESVSEIQFANVHRGDEAAHGHEQDRPVEESEHTVSADAVGIHQLGRGSPQNGGAYGGWCSVM